MKAGSTVMTDEFTSYKGLIYKGYIHRFVEHNKEQYGRGNVHINGMENFWSWANPAHKFSAIYFMYSENFMCGAKEQMFKFHGVFRKNLFYYLKEMEWKFNNRALRPKEKAMQIAKIFPCEVGNFKHQQTEDKPGRAIGNFSDPPGYMPIGV